MKGYVLILGAMSDIARPLAREYAAAGYNLYLADPQPALLAEDCARLKSLYGIEAKALSFDLLYFNGHEKFFHRLDPRPSIVICIGGYLGDHQLATGDMEEVSKIIQINFVGPVSILNIAADCYEKEKSGFIVGVGSVMGQRGFHRHYFYSAAKAAFSAYLSGLRNRLASSGVRVLTVKPGFVATKMTAGISFPRWLISSPEKVARDIFRAQQKGGDVLYTPAYWKFIMWIFIHLPERLFKRMKF
ncbi:MAG: SDR family NAD(P)-dependent oxidoreductase [Nitrospinae bacterium]|nr:SDR family NAD(P)-dependent oxidoreductase [Nitrospinota bacterium]